MVDVRPRCRQQTTGVPIVQGGQGDRPDMVVGADVGRRDAVEERQGHDDREAGVRQRLRNESVDLVRVRVVQDDHHVLPAG